MPSSSSSGNYGNISYHPSKGCGRLRHHLFRPRLLLRRIRPLLKKTWTGARRQNGGASPAQYRSLATSVANERSPVGRQPTPIVAIKHASTSSRVTCHQLYFSFLLFTWHSSGPRATAVALFPSSIDSLCPGADDPSLNFLFSFGMDHRPCVRCHPVCEYPAESHRGRRTSGAKTAASLKLKFQQ